MNIEIERKFQVFNRRRRAPSAGSTPSGAGA
jgi:hypothetical protein